MAYRAGKKARRMYRHYDRYGTAGMTKRQLRALRREMDLEQRNPRRKYGSAKARWLAKYDQADRALKRPLKRRRYKAWNKAQGRAVRKYWRNPVMMNPRRPTVTDLDRARWSSWAPKHLPKKRKKGWLRDQEPLRFRVNPKRDGTPTRGEKRITKRGEYLKVLVQRTRDAEARLAKIHGVPASSPVAAREHAPAVAPILEGGMSAIATLGAVQEVEHAEAKHLRQSIADLNMLIESTKSEAESLGENDEALAEELMEQVAKFARQRKKLQDRAQELGIKTNPPRRGQRRHVLVGLKAYRHALQACRSALRTSSRSRPHSRRRSRR